jgi:hypothetical protein
MEKENCEIIDNTKNLNYAIKQFLNIIKKGE